MVTRNTGRTLVRDLDNTVISAISFSTEVILNLVLTVLRYCTMILLTLEASYNIVFLRIDTNIVILIV